MCHERERWCRSRGSVSTTARAGFYTYTSCTRTRFSKISHGNITTTIPRIMSVRHPAYLLYDGDSSVDDLRFEFDSITFRSKHTRSTDSSVE